MAKNWYPGGKIVGKVPQSPVLPGTVAMILNGALLPEGADMVIRFEDAKVTEQYIEPEQVLKPYHNVVFAGEDDKMNDH